MNTRKHKVQKNPNCLIPDTLTNIFKCKCGKIYKHLSTLCAHKKKCTNIVINDIIMHFMSVKLKIITTILLSY
jgi:hypothetical protein